MCQHVAHGCRRPRGMQPPAHGAESAPPAATPAPGWGQPAPRPRAAARCRPGTPGVRLRRAARSAPEGRSVVLRGLESLAVRCVRASGAGVTCDAVISSGFPATSQRPSISGTTPFCRSVILSILRGWRCVRLLALPCHPLRWEPVRNAARFVTEGCWPIRVRRKTKGSALIDDAVRAKGHALVFGGGQPEPDFHHRLLTSVILQSSVVRRNRAGRSRSTEATIVGWNLMTHPSGLDYDS